MPKITVFMAVFNGSAYLKESIDSVLNQTFEDFELLIINDGSTDNSVDIISSYNDSRIRLLNNDQNKGLLFTRNRSIKEARGKYLAVLDCDDIALPYRLQLQFDYLENNPHVALCGGHTQFVNETGIEINELKMPLHNLPIEMLFLNVFINSALMIRTDVIKHVGGYQNYRCAGDFDLSLRIAEHYKVANLDNVLVKYRFHENNMSSSQNDIMVSEELSIIKDIHYRLGLITNQHQIAVHHAVYVLDYKKYQLTDYMGLLEKLKEGNIKNNKYDTHSFNKFIYEKWYGILRSRGERKVFRYFLNTKLLYYPAIKFKHLRKILKQTIGIKS